MDEASGRHLRSGGPGGRAPIHALMCRPVFCTWDAFARLPASAHARRTPAWTSGGGCCHLLEGVFLAHLVRTVLSCAGERAAASSPSPCVPGGICPGFSSSRPWSSGVESPREGAVGDGWDVPSSRWRFQRDPQPSPRCHQPLSLAPCPTHCHKSPLMCNLPLSQQ